MNNIIEWFLCLKCRVGVWLNDTFGKDNTVHMDIIFRKDYSDRLAQIAAGAFQKIKEINRQGGKSSKARIDEVKKAASEEMKLFLTNQPYVIKRNEKHC